MSKAHIVSEATIGECVGSGNAAAPGAADLLAFAAAPAFGVMMLWTCISGGQSDLLCTAIGSESPLNEMALMYALMSAFHLTPWLRLLSRCRKEGR